jgi:ureidoglycolate dehydrogenase (NAD+)
MITKQSTRISAPQLEQWTVDLLRAAGVDPGEATVVARMMVWADTAGRTTQGVWRLPELLNKFKLGGIRSPSRPEFVRKSGSVDSLDGRDGFGQYVAFLAMNRAVEIARRTGIGMVAVRNSSHFGAAAAYAELAAKSDQIGLVMTNASRRVAPHGGRDPVFGTNPIAFAAPLEDGRPLLIDFSTSASSGSAVRKAVQEGRKIEAHVMVDDRDRTLTDISKVMQAPLLPFGGAKGSCLALMVEVLCGVLTGGRISAEIPSTINEPEKSQHLGHLMLAIDIGTFLEPADYRRRMDQLISEIKNSNPCDGSTGARIPGESRWRHRERHLKDGIEIDVNTLEALDALAKQIGVRTPW